MENERQIISGGDIAPKKVYTLSPDLWENSISAREKAFEMGFNHIPMEIRLWSLLTDTQIQTTLTPEVVVEIKDRLEKSDIFQVKPTHRPLKAEEIDLYTVYLSMAEEIRQREEAPEIEPIHLFYTLIHQDEISELIGNAGIDYKELDDMILKYLPNTKKGLDEYTESLPENIRAIFLKPRPLQTPKERRELTIYQANRSMSEHANTPQNREKHGL